MVGINQVTHIDIKIGYKINKTMTIIIEVVIIDERNAHQ